MGIKSDRYLEVVSKGDNISNSLSEAIKWCFNKRDKMR